MDWTAFLEINLPTFALGAIFGLTFGLLIGHLYFNRQYRRAVEAARADARQAAISFRDKFMHQLELLRDAHLNMSDAHHTISVIDTRIQELLHLSGINVTAVPDRTQQIPEVMPAQLQVSADPR